MNITFLLGNGFDIGLKTPTRYEDFYVEYCKITADDNDNIKKFKMMLQERNKDEVKKIIDWADFEKAFGEHSKDPEITTKRNYLERFEHFVETFNAYLENVESCVDYSDADSIAKITDTAVKAFHHIRTADKNGSHIICTYGMSIGETDKKWWNKVSSWLLGDSKRILVILVHESKYNSRFPHQQDRFIRPILEKFLSFSGLSDTDKKKIENRIFVGVNNDVFAMNLYHAKPKTHPSVQKIDPNMIFAGDVPPEESGLLHIEGQVYLQRVNVPETKKPEINQVASDAIDEYNASLPAITVV